MVKICPSCKAVHNDRDVHVPAGGGSTTERHVRYCQFCGTEVIDTEQYHKQEEDN